VRILLAITAAALLCAGSADGADVTVNAPVAGGSILTVSALNAPSFSVILNAATRPPATRRSCRW
jgi:hypothetical protein